MRLWSLHPRYLDARGLVALWREGLLAQAVLCGETRGYRHHPQLERFRGSPEPVDTIGAYLREVGHEAAQRGYRFDASRIRRPGASASLPVTSGQVALEWQHLLAKLAVRDPARYERLRDFTSPECHPLFDVAPGGVEPWERAGLPLSSPSG